jgi:cytochrome c-type biogenesis protein CcmH/NrfG
MRKKSRRPPQRKAAQRPTPHREAARVRTATAREWPHADLLVSVLLVIATAAVWAGTVRNGFVGSDDDFYVYENPHVLAGLTWSGIAWAFTTGYYAWWHPITWLSHMLDVSLFGIRPAGHHVMSLLFHLANTVLVYGLLSRMTGARARSAAVAALFALHPLHVESVAWVSERKDLLGAFFGFLSIAAWLRWVDTRKKLAYAASLVLFALSLASKPMLVTLPFLLLLLDWWPLARWNRQQSRSLLVEKIPYFLLSAAGSAAAYFAQKHGRAMMLLPWAVRVDNAVLSYVRYIGKLFFPTRLAMLYPLSFVTHGWLTVGAALLLAALTAACLFFGKRHRYLATGWLWYLGALVPVLGLVQVGRQAFADRYMYVPGIGLLVIVVWGIADLTRGWAWRRAALATLTAASLVVLSALTILQIRHWRDSTTLFEHTLSVTENNPLIEISLGRWNDAIGHLEETLRLQPDSPEMLYSLGAALETTGRVREAADRYREALRLNPDYAEAHSNLGLLLLRQDKAAEALPHIRETARLDPASVQARADLATVLATLARHEEAARELREALRLSPDSTIILARLAVELASTAGADPARSHEAFALARTACEKTQWRDPALLDIFARFQAGAGLFDEAARTTRRAIVLAQQTGAKELIPGLEARQASYRQKTVVPLTP